jgi:hypothetical protein
MGAFGDIWRKSGKSQIKILLIVPVTIFENANFIALMLCAALRNTVKR